MKMNEKFYQICQNIQSIKQNLSIIFKFYSFSFRFDGEVFIESLQSSVYQRLKRNKTPRKIRYYHYCLWARELKMSNIGPEGCCYSFPQEVLDYIRCIAAGDIVGEIKDDAYEVDMNCFCQCVKIPKLYIHFGTKDIYSL